MKIVDNTKKELTEYRQGDVIEKCGDFFLVMYDATSDNYGLLNLKSNEVYDLSGGLDILFEDQHQTGDKLVDAHLEIDK